MSFNALSAVKFVATGVVGIGTGKIVGRIIKTHVAPETLIEKVTVTAASWVISAMATQATKKYTDEVVDTIVDNFDKLRQTISTSEKLGRINRGESTFVKEGLDPKDFTKRNDGKWVRANDIDGETVPVEDAETNTEAE